MPTRYLCDVLEDMRVMNKTRNFSGLLGSIEQAQVMASRMEAALGNKRTLEEYDEQASALGRELRESKKEVRKLDAHIANLNAEKKKVEKALNRFRHQYDKETKGGTLDCPSDVAGDCKECPHCGSRHTGPCGPYDIG